MSMKTAFKSFSILLALSVLTPLSAHAMDKIKVGYLKIPPLVHMIYGLDQGIFKKNNLDVDLTIINGGPEMMSALESGSIQIGQTSAAIVLVARAKGLKVKSFGTADYEAKDDMRNWIVTSQESGVKTFKDLEGKTVGIVAKNSPAELTVRDHMVRNGADPDKVNFVALPFPQLPAALEVGNVQAVMVGEPFYTQIKESKKIHSVTLGEGLIATVQDGERIALGGWFATDAWLADAKNQDIARRYLRSVMEANRALAADRSLVNAALEKGFGMPPAVAAGVKLPINTNSLIAKPSDYQPIVKAYVRTKMIPKEYPAEEAVTTLEY